MEKMLMLRRDQPLRICRRAVGTLCDIECLGSLITQQLARKNIDVIHSRHALELLGEARKRDAVAWFHNETKFRRTDRREDLQSAAKADECRRAANSSQHFLKNDLGSGLANELENSMTPQHLNLMDVVVLLSIVDSNVTAPKCRCGGGDVRRDTGVSLSNG